MPLLCWVPSNINLVCWLIESCEEELTLRECRMCKFRFRVVGNLEVNDREDYFSSC
jgi:hypothetical protein